MPSLLRSAAIGTALMLLVAGASTSAQQPGSARAAEPIDVRTQPAAAVLQDSMRSAAAAVLAPNDSLIAAEITAVVAKVDADVGASVARGDRLLTRDCTDTEHAARQARAQRSAAEAGLALADQRLQRGKMLSEKKFLSADELLELGTGRQSAAAELEVARAQAAIAARQVDKCRIEAPFAGVVMQRQAQVGALATPGMPLLRLVDRSGVEVEASIPASDAASLEAATAVELESQGRRLPLRLLRLSDVIDPQSRTRLARFGFVDATADAGASGSLHWRVAGRRLPAELLVQRDGSLGVFVADNGSARFVALPDAQPGRPVDLVDPPAGDIIVEGQQRLQHGDAIRVTGSATPEG